ncbi:MAG: class I SAM-dependent methyltransferase [Candidatus Portnoybacteria bacterium]|nr:class I SAM-dependent methyltransferase [Candidatus Portnoybacteria bacterium]
MKKIFERIYLDKVWYKGSGSGSLPSNTKKYRSFLRDYIKKNNIEKVIDIGCGDWGFSRLMDWSGMQYLGIDVVGFIIDENKKRWESDNVKFRCADVRKIKLPKADLIIIKDVLQHWTSKEILRFVKKIKRFPHILITNSFKGASQAMINQDIKNGEARPLDLSAPPFNLKIKELLKYRSWRPARKIWETKKIVRLDIIRQA